MPSFGRRSAAEEEEWEGVETYFGDRRRVREEESTHPFVKRGDASSSCRRVEDDHAVVDDVADVAVDNIAVGDSAASVANRSHQGVVAADETAIALVPQMI